MLNHKFSSLDWMNTGERIKTARKAAGLSQEALGKAAKVSKGSVSQWESGLTKNLRMENLFAVEDATGYRARWLALGEGPEKVNDPGVSNTTREEMAQELDNATDEDIAIFLRLIAARLSK